MNTSKRLILASIIVGTLGVTGLARLVYANQTHVQVAVMPQHHSSQVAETSDGDSETNDDVKERQGSPFSDVLKVFHNQAVAKLQSLAKITPQQAQQVAEAAVKGTASSVKLESENGGLVYAVVIGQKEVKVDAGNGRVLYTDTPGNEQQEGNRPKSSIQVPQSMGATVYTQVRLEWI